MSKARFGRIFVGFMAGVLLCLAATAGATVVTIEGGAGSVNAVACSPDGTMVLTGHYDDVAKLWNAATGAFVRSFTGHTNSVYAVAFSPDGTRVLTGSADGTAKVWNTATGALVATFTGHTFWLYSVAFSPNGKKVVTGGYDGTAKIWDAYTAPGTLLRSITENTDGYSVMSVAFSPDGTELATGSANGTAKRWNPDTGGLISTITENVTKDYVSSVAYSPDGTKLFTGSGNCTAKLWNVGTGALLRTFTGHTLPVYTLACSTDGLRLLTGSIDGTAKLWDTGTGGDLRTITAHTGEVYGVAFSPNGNSIVTGGIDGTAIVETTLESVAGTIVINDNRATTTSPQVSLALNWWGGFGTGATRMRFSDDGAHWTAWEPLLKTRAYTLPAGDGYKTVRVQFRDSQGNSSAVASDFIRLDGTPPTGSIIINSGAATTTAQKVTLGLTWSDGTGSGVTRMRFSDNGATWTAWETLKASRAYTLPAGLGYHTVRAQFLDAAGNYSAVYNDYIKIVAP